VLASESTAERERTSATSQMFHLTGRDVVAGTIERHPGDHDPRYAQV
jgi:hypothetical protein